MYDLIFPFLSVGIEPKVNTGTIYNCKGTTFFFIKQNPFKKFIVSDLPIFRGAKTTAMLLVNGTI